MSSIMANIMSMDGNTATAIDSYHHHMDAAKSAISDLYLCKVATPRSNHLFWFSQSCKKREFAVYVVVEAQEPF